MENVVVNNEKELAYDLRQVWVKLVGEQLEDVKEAKKSNICLKYYQELEDLYDLVQQKFNNKSETIKNIQNLRAEVIELANKNKLAWLGQIQNDSVNKMTDKLRLMERMLYDSMEEANMYGAKFDDEGL